MILEILGVAQQEDKGKQRLLLKVTADGNLSDYAVVDNTYKNGIPSNLHQHYYSFPSHPVKKNDHVILYTSEGSDRSLPQNDGTKYHFFYWNLDISVWNAIDTAHILKIVASSDKKI